VVVADQAKAQAITTATRAGKSFVSVAASLGGFSAADINLGALSQAKFADATNAAIAAAAFKAPLRGVTDPIKSDFGWHVVSVDGVNAPRIQGVSAARDTIATQLRDAKTEDALADMVAKIEDGFASGQSFADIAKQFKLTLVTVPAITRDGNANGFTMAPAAVPLIAKAFEADLGDSASVQELVVAAQGSTAKTVQYAVLELGDITRSSPAPLATISALVTSAWAVDARLAKLRDLSRLVLADTKKGVTLSASLASHRLPAAQPLAGRQIDVARQGNVPPPVQLFLTSPKGVAQMLESPGGIFIVQVASITAGDTTPFPQIVDASRRQLASLVGEEISGAFARAAEREVGVKRNDAMLAATTKRILGEDAAAAQ
jgi:peptidyl-prolyl cis-trans isomerase D